MKGITHGAIGLAAASLAQLSVIVLNPNEAHIQLLPFALSYAGALLPDIDTNNSTISNKLNPLKSKMLRKIIITAYVILSAYLMLNFNQKYLLSILISVGLIGLCFGSTSKFNKVFVIALSAGICAYGVYYKRYDYIISGVLLATLSFSPHRGYSHSLLTVIAVFVASNSIFGRMDFAIYLAIGVLSHLLADMFTEMGVVFLFPYNKKIKFPKRIKTGSSIEIIITITAVAVALVAMLTANEINPVKPENIINFQSTENLKLFLKDTIIK